MSEAEQNDRSAQSQPAVSGSGGDRPGVKVYVQTSKFRAGDSVRVILSGGRREGPYLVELVTSVARYTLCFENGESARGGAVVHEKDLEAA
ncbi:hypothetical protein BKA65DRAFT_496675 [Rhexocercosporidium sp. MPI-PUGE-AT-0058]|nr:hypothetical protein BKA65DRAFT_496675 [Rhexocercosporidium sp. MPI-PUGE-AT-0058]